MSIGLVSGASEKSVLNRITQVFITNEDPIDIAFNGTASKTIILADGAYMVPGDVWEGYHGIDVRGYRKVTVYYHIYFHDMYPVDLDSDLGVNFYIPMASIHLSSPTVIADTSAGSANVASITTDVIGPYLDVSIWEYDYSDYQRTYWLAVYLTN